MANRDVKANTHTNKRTNTKAAQPLLLCLSPVFVPVWVRFGASVIGLAGCYARSLIPPVSDSYPENNKQPDPCKILPNDWSIALAGGHRAHARKFARAGRFFARSYFFVDIIVLIGCVRYYPI